MTWKGNLSVYGSNGTPTVISGSLSTQSLRGTHSFNLVTLKNSAGQTVGWGTPEDETDIDAMFRPIATALATAKNALQFPEAISKITWTTTDTNATRGLDGDYCYLGGDLGLGNESVAELSLRMKKNANVNLNNSYTTP